MINPTGYTALDLVGFTDKGTYASNVNYVKNDIVHYGGNLWRCKIDDTMNVTPAEGNNWTVFVGEPTNLVERIIAPLEENPATVAYAAGRQIIYDDWLWEVIDDIAVGDVLIDYDVDPTNANIKKAAPVETQLLAIKAKEGNLANLNTTEKTDLVLSINEVNDKTKYKILQRGTAYSVDDFVLCKSASNSLIFVCTTAGTTADQEPTAYATVTDGNTVTDGTAVFIAVSVSGQITKLSKTEDLISIVENGNTCTHTDGISKGQYVNWKGNLYTADSNISVGATFASSGGSKNLTAVTDGGLNNLVNNSIKIATLSTPLVIDYADSNTIGYRTTSSNLVDITTLSSYPTGHTVLAYFAQPIDTSYGQVVWIDGNQRLHGVSKASSTINVRIDVFYI